jgi:hypothetical protein
LLYRKQKRVYGEHLVFALHANAFAFLLASLMMACPGNVAWVAIAGAKVDFHYITAWDDAQLLPFVWPLA